ncbi:YkgJ family cysteine cluster protein [Candidatus Micrarchaeota archaeon]|nr:YkgJ family cysteine cluster protein [Candidatus Micrarchaeota archaeon]
MCLGCDGRCCGLVADLTPFDIARIVHIEGKSADDFVGLKIGKKDDAFAFRAQGGYFKFVIAHKDGKCVFLRSGPLNCGIENSKPAICLVYPFSVSWGGPYVRREALCPQANRLRVDNAKMSPKVLEDCYWESSRYEESIRIWNKNAKGNETPEQFFRFAASDLDAYHAQFGNIKRGFGRFMLRIGLR